MRSWVFRLSVVVCLLPGLGLTGSVHAAAATTQHQIEANRPIPVPDTTSCHETIASHDFGNSYGSPYIGSYHPPAKCSGPWNTVVLTLTSSVGGVQFDRDVYVAVGNAVMLDGSTSEPCCSGNDDVTWRVQRDVTADSALLRHKQPVIVQLDNVMNSTYTGVYDTTVGLTFYDADAAHPAPHTPAVVLPLASNNPTSPMLTVDKSGEKVGGSVTFPTNLSKLTAEIFADAHGPCEEFWWTDPSGCAGSPYREVAVYIDGQLAGAAPTYPVTYTGADGPGLWEPIPSPRAWNLRPYDVNLTPFVPTLTDGKPHTVTLGVLDATYTSGDFWAVSANLFGWEQQHTAVTTGQLTRVSAPAEPTDSAPGSSSSATYSDTASHVLTYKGWIKTPGGRRVSKVHESMGESAMETEATTNNNYYWDTTDKTRGGGGRVAVSSTKATYSAKDSDLTSFGFTDDATTTMTVNGAIRGATALVESMTTKDASGEAESGAESERYGFTNRAGACYDHRIQSEVYEITRNTFDQKCPALP